MAEAYVEARRRVQNELSYWTDYVLNDYGPKVAGAGNITPGDLVKLAVSLTQASLALQTHE